MTPQERMDRRVFLLIEPAESPTRVLGFFSLSACQATPCPQPFKSLFPGTRP